MHCITLNGYFLTPFNTPAMACLAGLAMSKSEHVQKMEHLIGISQ